MNTLKPIRPARTATDENGRPREILLVEDDETIRDAVAAYLAREGYHATGAGNGRDALECFSKGHYDMVILDLIIPEVSGEVVCRKIREMSDVPIIILTAKGCVEDRVIGFELGADDYMVKPFSPRELVVRVNTILRRVDISRTPQRGCMELGEIDIDAVHGEVTCAEGGEGVDGSRRDSGLSLTPGEFDLLVMLTRFSERIYSYEEIAEKLYGYKSTSAGEIDAEIKAKVDVGVASLRDKLGDDDVNGTYLIHSVFGVGYQYTGIINDD